MHDVQQQQLLIGAVVLLGKRRRQQAKTAAAAGENGGWRAPQRETDIGDVRINPAMEYKSFQLLLSEKIGISPNQISIYHVNGKRSRKLPLSDDRCRIPITGKANFGAICLQRECCFIVILKRSRKSRSHRERTIGGGHVLRRTDPSVPLPQQHLILLRRSQPTWISQPEGDDPNRRLCGLGVAGDAAKSLLLSGDSFPVIDSTWFAVWGNEEMKASYEECRKAEESGGTASFHPCINDAVITQFTTPTTIEAT